MDFSWTIAIYVVVINLIWVCLMFSVHRMDYVRGNLPYRGSTIPGTVQPFLWMDDFHIMTWGDIVGIPMILTAFAHLVANGYIGLCQWGVFIAVAAYDADFFRRMCLSKDHKPDWGFPEVGKISWGGISHLPYHGVGVAGSAISLVHLALGHLSWSVACYALTGAAIYIASVAADVLTGKFDPLRIEGAELNLMTPQRLQMLAERANMPHEPWDLDADDAKQAPPVPPWET